MKTWNSAGKIFFITFLFVLTWSVSVSSARGQEASAPIANMDEVAKAPVALMAIPPRLGDDGSLEAKPGETIQTQVRVRNSSPIPLRVATMVEDFIIGEDGKTPVPVMGQTSSRWSLAQWMQLSLEDVVLYPGNSQTIPVFIRIPEDALPGGRYAMILHQPVVGAPGSELTAPVGGQAAISQRVGTLVYLRVSGDVKEEAHVRNLQVPGFQEFGPVPVQFEIENQSDIHLSPSVVVEIRNTWGKLVETISVESQNIFPYTNRPYKTEWQRLWGLGRYSARVVATYGTQGKVEVADSHFLIFPYKLILSLILLFLSLVAMGIAIRRHLQYRENASDQHIQLLEDRISQLENELNRRDE